MFRNIRGSAFLEYPLLVSILGLERNQSNVVN